MLFNNPRSFKPRSDSNQPQTEPDNLVVSSSKKALEKESKGHPNTEKYNQSPVSQHNGTSMAQNLSQNGTKGNENSATVLQFAAAQQAAAAAAALAFHQKQQQPLQSRLLPQHTVTFSVFCPHIFFDKLIELMLRLEMIFYLN